MLTSFVGIQQQTDPSDNMSNWETKDLAEALPATEKSQNGEGSAAVPDASSAPEKKMNPQAAGWVPKTEYDYDTYNKSTKELFESQAESDSARVDWASNAAVYEWDDEFGDIGPEHAELEKMLFASEFHMKSGIEFKKYSTMS